MLKIDFDPPVKQLRQFGFISLVGFPLVGVMLTQVGKLPLAVLWVAIAVGVSMGLLALANATAAIRPVYVVMMLIAWPIGMVISTVLLGAIYYGMFTLVGLWFRITGRDPLQRKWDPAATTYWRVRETQRKPASYLRLY